MARRLGFPPSVISRLGGSDPVELGNLAGLSDIDSIAIRPAPRWLTTIWRSDVAAMTVPWAIYVRRDVLGGDSNRLAALVGHELVHVRQWRQLGSLRFVRRYLIEYLRGRRKGLSHAQAYLGISFEKEAREISGH
jgi:hypothetical protein